LGFDATSLAFATARAIDEAVKECVVLITGKNQQGMLSTKFRFLLDSAAATETGIDHAWTFFKWVRFISM
jgi:hypothetical protein